MLLKRRRRVVFPGVVCRIERPRAPKKIENQHKKRVHSGASSEGKVGQVLKRYASMKTLWFSGWGTGHGKECSELKETSVGMWVYVSSAVEMVFSSNSSLFKVFMGLFLFNAVCHLADVLRAR